MRIKPSKRRGRSGAEGKKGKRGAGGASSSADAKGGRLGADKRVGPVSVSSKSRRVGPPAAPRLTPLSGSGFQPPPFSLPTSLLDVFARRAPQQAAPPTPAEMLELSKAALEQSILLSQAAGSFGARDDYASVAPAAQQPMHHSYPPLPPMAPPMPPMHSRAPMPPMALSSLQPMTCGHLSAGHLPMPLRNVTGPGRSSGDWSAAPTTMASLDSTTHESVCGGVWAEGSCRSLSSANSGLDDLDFDGLFDLSSGLEGLAVSWVPPPMLKPKAAPSRSPDPQSAAESLSFLWGQDEQRVRWGAAPTPAMQFRAAALPPAIQEELSSTSSYGAAAPGEQQLFSSAGCWAPSNHVASQLEHLFSE